MLHSVYFRIRILENTILGILSMYTDATCLRYCMNGPEGLHCSLTLPMPLLETCLRYCITWSEILYYLEHEA
jgi:hypothetical protein